MLRQILSLLGKVELLTVTDKERDISFISKLPADYTSFICQYDGGVGFIGNEGYINLWQLDEVISFNPYIEEFQFYQEVILVGSNGSGTFFGYDLKENRFFEADEFEMTREEAHYCGDRFVDLLLYLNSKEY